MLFEPGTIGTLELPNRLVRSATAECLADRDGAPTPALEDLYRALAQGGVGLIVTGHFYVHPSGVAHPAMVGIHDDALIEPLSRLADAVHEQGGRVVCQLNHAGMQTRAKAVREPISPSAITAPFLRRAARAMTGAEVETMIEAYADAAVRAKQSGFDGVQLHGAHGYLINQFLSPFVNRRADGWGGDAARRRRFLEVVCTAIRDRVGPAYPVLIKLGMQDAVDGGLTIDEAVEIVSELERMGIDGVELSGGIDGGRGFIMPKGIANVDDEGFFRAFAVRAREATRLAILLVGGFRSRSVMEDVLVSGNVDFISLCRPLICEPDLPNRLRDRVQQRSSCVSGNRCWPESRRDPGISCKCFSGAGSPT